MSDMLGFGASNSAENKLTTYNILYGQFRTRTEAGAEGAKARKLEKGKNKGKEVWEIGYDTFAGLVKKIQLHPGDFGNDIAIDFATKDPNVADSRVYIGLFSSQGRSLINTLLNWNTANPIRLVLWEKPNSDGKHLLFVKQRIDGIWEDVERKYNEWDDEAQQLKGLPPVTVAKVNGEDVYNYDEHVKALTDELQKNVLSVLQKEPWIYDVSQRDEAPAAQDMSDLGGNDSEEDEFLKELNDV